MVHQQILMVAFVFNAKKIVKNALLLVASIALRHIIYKLMDHVHKIVNKEIVIIFKF